MLYGGCESHGVYLQPPTGDAWQRVGAYQLLLPSNRIVVIGGQIA